MRSSGVVPRSQGRRTSDCGASDIVPPHLNDVIIPRPTTRRRQDLHLLRWRPPKPQMNEKLLRRVPEDQLRQVRIAHFGTPGPPSARRCSQGIQARHIGPFWTRIQSGSAPPSPRSGHRFPQRKQTAISEAGFTTGFTTSSSVFKRWTPLLIFFQPSLCHQESFQPHDQSHDRPNSHTSRSRARSRQEFSSAHSDPPA